MATKRRRGNGWEYIVKRKGLLKKPWSRTFASEAEGDAYIAKLEALLDQGIIPEEMNDDKNNYPLLNDLIVDYLIKSVVAESDRKLLKVISARVGATRSSAINYAWVEDWIFDMKVKLNIKPVTIKHYVGALGRCIDWATRRGVPAFVSNPIRSLPRGYAQYNANDARTAMIEDEDFEKQEDEVRERRLTPEEEARVRSVMNGDPIPGRERSFKLRYQAAVELMFELALETAMRMREIFLLNTRQIELDKVTIFLNAQKGDYTTKTKAQRQIPLSTIEVKAIRNYIECVEKQERGMEGFNFEEGRLFPWAVGAKTEEEYAKITRQLSKQFARIFDAAQCEDFHFHDLRHEATSRLFEKTSMIEVEVMSITGHTSTKMLKRYTNLRGSDLAKKMW